jgi:hypothetical protein
VFKKKEKAELEPKQVEAQIVLNINGEEVADVLTEETEFEMVETKNKNVKKRKLDDSEQPSKKKKKYDTIVDWGALGENDDDDDGARDEGIWAWLTGEDKPIISEETVNVQSGFDVPEPKKLKQMEIEFVKRVSETWPILSPEMV